MMSAQGLQVTVLDHDADTVEGLRQFGFRVFYGDATRLDLLRTAGAGTAKAIVVAVDDIEQSLEIVDLAREHFPQTQIVARARNLNHWYQLRDREVHLAEREVFESSLRSARSVLEVLGWPAHEARDAAMRFRHRNIGITDAGYPHYKDRAKLIAVAKEGRQQFEEQMARERAQRQERSGRGWEDESLEGEELPSGGRDRKVHYRSLKPNVQERLFDPVDAGGDGPQRRRREGVRDRSRMSVTAKSGAQPAKPGGPAQARSNQPA